MYTLSSAKQPAFSPPPTELHFLPRRRQPGVIQSPSCCPRLGPPPTGWIPVWPPPGLSPFAETHAQEKTRLGLRPIRCRIPGSLFHHLPLTLPGEGPPGTPASV